MLWGTKGIKMWLRSWAQVRAALEGRGRRGGHKTASSLTTPRLCDQPPCFQYWQFHVPGDPVVAGELGQQLLTLQGGVRGQRRECGAGGGEAETRDGPCAALGRDGRTCPWGEGSELEEQISQWHTSLDRRGHCTVGDHQLGGLEDPRMCTPRWECGQMGFRTRYPQIQHLSTLNILGWRSLREQKQEGHSEPLSLRLVRKPAREGCLLTPGGKGLRRSRTHRPCFVSPRLLQFPTNTQRSLSLCLHFLMKAFVECKT